MTNKEAAAIVERIRYYMEGGECWTPTEFKAMDMAIGSLNRQDIHDINVSDMIYRQMAIDALGAEPLAISEYEEGLHTMWTDAKESIEQLPPAQPVDEGYLIDWYISSVDNSEPVWTEAHIEELMNDFYLIPKGVY